MSVIDVEDKLYQCLCKNPKARICLRHDKIWMSKKEQKFVNELFKSNSKTSKIFKSHIEKFLGMPILITDYVENLE